MLTTGMLQVTRIEMGEGWSVVHKIFSITLLTVASLATSSSEAPREARPISCENWAKLGSANNGICPRIS